MRLPSRDQATDHTHPECPVKVKRGIAFICRGLEGVCRWVTRAIPPPAIPMAARLARPITTLRLEIRPGWVLSGSEVVSGRCNEGAAFSMDVVGGDGISSGGRLCTVAKLSSGVSTL